MRRGSWLGALGLLAVACGAPVEPTAETSSGPVAAPSQAALGTPSASTPPTPSPRPTPTPIPSVLDDEVWLAVQTQTAAGYGVHLVRPDGTGLHRWPAPVPGTHEHPDWSPDGQWILLNAVMPDGTEDLWVGRVDGSETRLLHDCVKPCLWVDEAAWSPDGSQVAFQRLVERDDGHLVSTLERLDVTSGETSVVLTMPHQQIVLQPRWSPDGRRIVVEVIHLEADSLDADIDDGAIGVIDLDDPVPQVRRIAGDLANSPDWSPDGSLVLWSRPGPDGEGSDLWVATPDGSDARRVTNLADDGGRADQPAFAPDGRSIVFVWKATIGGAAKIGQVAPDGSGLASATGELAVDGMHPRLRPVD